jgi:hypothetical protein
MCKQGSTRTVYLTVIRLQRLNVMGWECVKHDGAFLDETIRKFDSWYDVFQVRQAERRRNAGNVANAGVSSQGGIARRGSAESPTSDDEEESSEEPEYVHRGTKRRPIAQ